MDRTSFREDLDEILDTLESAGTLENLKFTKDQARFINLLISLAIEKYDKENK